MLLNIKNIDFNKNPQDDFYNFCNGKWLINNKIPKKYSSWNSFKELGNKNLLKIKTIIKECKNSNDHMKKLIYTLYKNGMNTKKRNKQDIKYIIPLLDKIHNLTTKKDISKIVSFLHKTGINCLFYIYIDADSKESSMNRLHISHSFLGLPNKDYYIDKKFENIQKEYKSYLYNLLKNIKKKYIINKDYQNNIFEFEKKIATMTLSEANKRNSIKMYNKIKINNFCKKFKEFNWNIYFDELEINTENIIYDDAAFYEGIDMLIKNKSLETWKNYFYFCILDNLSPYLSTYYEKLEFDFYSKTLSGIKIKNPKWEMNVSIVNNYLDDAIGILFVKKYFNEKSKKYVEDMIKNFKKTFMKIINQLEWMEEKTKIESKKKLNSIIYKVGYPDKSTLINYNKLDLVSNKSNSFVENILTCKKFYSNIALKKLDKKVDIKEWHMSPQTVNAYYNPNQNEIVFPASILQPPFFSIKQSDAENYGSIGVIIGHEITHGFDDEGRKYNYNGNLYNWWTKKDVYKFKKEANKLVMQYNQHKINNIKVNGSLTLGENLADLGGIKIAMYSFLNKIHKKMNNNDKKQNQITKKTNTNTKITNIKKISDFSQLQQFFISYATIWKSLITKKESIKRLKSNEHSPNNLRVNIPLSNIDLFYSTFNIKKNDKMYLDMKKRCKVW